VAGLKKFEFAASDSALLLSADRWSRGDGELRRLGVPQLTAGNFCRARRFLLLYQRMGGRRVSLLFGYNFPIKN
jgi:hypothetical protein